MTLPPFSQLSDLLKTDVEEVPLEDIAFLIAKENYPESPGIPKFNDAPYRKKIADFVERASLKIGGVLGARQKVEGLSHYLFEDELFRGNTRDYYNPSNSFLNDVLDSREGIPISLSLLYVIIGRKLGMNLFGVSFPGHFLVRYEEEEGVLFIDPYHKGKILTTEDCQERLKEMYDDRLPFHLDFLEPATNREIILRMLTNLKVIYLMKENFEMALKMLNLLLQFRPESVQELKERGLVSYQLECFAPALSDLETYLKEVPQDPDRKKLKKYIEELRHKVDQMV